MTYRGRIQNGVVVFDGGRRPKDGTVVEVRPLTSDAARAPARKPTASKNGTKALGEGSAEKRGNGRARGPRDTLDDLARAQGVTGAGPFEELLGGWPAGEADDGFEDAVADWRAEEPRRGEF